MRKRTIAFLKLFLSSARNLMSYWSTKPMSFMHYISEVILGVLVFLIFISSTYVRRIIFGKHKIEKSQCIVVITGCDTGFGALLCTKLTCEGFFVIATVLTSDGLINLNGKVGHVIRCDVTSQFDVDELGKIIRRIADEKNLSLWAVVNNAGIADGCLIDWTPVEMYQLIMDVNYFGVIRVVKATLDLLKRTKNSRIINLSSLAGLTGISTLGGYCGSKHAVEGLAKSLRDDLRVFGIHVANVNPGFMRTPIITKGMLNAKRLYDNLPEQLKSVYSHTFVEESASLPNTLAEDPVLVVNQIAELITDRYPNCNNFAGLSGIFTRLLLLLPWTLIETLTWAFVTTSPLRST